MKVTEHIKQANGKTLFSFEILPPKKGDNLQPNLVFGELVAGEIILSRNERKIRKWKRMKYQ